MLGGVDTKDGENRFMFRVGKENEAKSLKRKGAQPVILGERKMGGLIFVNERECDSDALKVWIKDAMDFAGSLPNK